MRGAVVAAVLAALAWPGGGAGSSAGFFVGFSDARPETDGAPAAAAAAQLGAAAIRFTLRWAAGESALTSADASSLARGVAAAGGLRVVLSVYGTTSAAPTDATGRAQYCSYVADALQQQPAIDDVVVWNEPNKAQFWSPQSGAPAAYESLLAQCYDVLHAERPDVNVLGFALSHDGSDDSSSTSPGAFIRAVGAAYRASGRSGRIFDTVAFHPYPLTSSERPWLKHVGRTTIGEGDWNKLMYNLWLAFNGTGQPIPGSGGVTIWYTEDGFQSTIPAAKAAFYTGTENAATLAETSAGDTSPSPPDTSPAPDQATQFADAVDLAACQPYVGAFFNFLLSDESSLAGWQSAPLYADLTEKASFPAFQAAIGAVSSGAVDCSALKGGLPSADFMPPSAPTGLSAGVTISPLSIGLSWTAATDDSGGPVTYRIYRNGGLVGTSPTASWTDTSVAAQQTYSYTVRALDAASNLGAASAAVQVTTPDTTPPQAPVALEATAAADGSHVDLSWQPATDNVAVTGYEISRDGVVVATTAATAWTDTAVVPGSTHMYSLVALDAAGNRSAAATIAVVVPVAPPAPAPAPAPAAGGGGAAVPPDLRVALAASSSAVAPGGEVDLVVTVSDASDGSSHDTHLAIDLPATATLLAPPEYEAGSGCTGTQQLDCFLDYIPANGVTHVRFNVHVFADSTIAVHATAAGAASTAADAATLVVTVVAPPAAKPPLARPATKGKLIVGTPRADRLVGTPRDDVLNGRGGNDVLIGGRGHDTLIGGPGDDTIYARDGERDVVDCGSGRDVVFADRFDKVARDCERVYRSK